MKVRFFFLLSALILPAALWGQDKPAGGDRPDAPGRERDRDRGRMWDRDRDRSEGGHPFLKLTEEERQRVREALSQVWHDSELQAARKLVKEANDAHRAALKAAILKADPDIREVLMKVMEPHLREGGEPDGDPRGRRGGAGDMERIRRKFSDEDWKLLSETRDKAMQTEAVQTLKPELGGGQGDWREAIARSKKFREVLRAEMIRIEPKVENLVDRMENELSQPPGEGRPPRGGRPGAPDGGGNGPDPAPRPPLEPEPEPDSAPL